MGENKEIEVIIVRPSTKTNVYCFENMLNDGYKIINVTACEDRIVYVLELK